MDRKVFPDYFGADRKDTTIRHCVPGVGGETEKELLDVSLPSLYVRQGITCLDDDLNSLSRQAVSEDSQCAVQRTQHVGLSDAPTAASRKGKHPAKDPAAGLYRLLNLL